MFPEVVLFVKICVRNTRPLRTHSGVPKDDVVCKPNIQAASFRGGVRRCGSETSPHRDIEKRRAHRVDLNAPVFLYGSADGEPFTDYSETIDVCSDGALVAINARLSPEQRILLTNLQTGQDLKCRVVRVDNHLQVAAVEFLEACPLFWCIEFALSATRR